MFGTSLFFLREVTAVIYYFHRLIELPDKSV